MTFSNTAVTPPVTSLILNILRSKRGLLVFRCQIMKSAAKTVEKSSRVYAMFRELIP